MNIGDKVKINSNEDVLEEIGLEVLLETPEIFSQVFKISETYWNKWYSIDGDFTIYGNMDLRDMSFNEDSLIQLT